MWMLCPRGWRCASIVVVRPLNMAVVARARVFVVERKRWVFKVGQHDQTGVACSLYKQGTHNNHCHGEHTDDDVDCDQRRSVPVA